ncbi:hypothetical protein [Olleya sp. HaHaR_3_96]|uniref:hypothetical protein n=1 Tax=Olleya sp. HaHaR_3_96 TaxID=2745560 RepID=UPI001C4F8BBE|nr:hypothetical protein [Olleya sp. HaHaR_3_96]QXP61043.1 hypothetical protein H0I26_05250 [Olleya sp. HaHaR_3_96]
MKNCSPLHTHLTHKYGINPSLKTIFGTLFMTALLITSCDPKDNNEDITSNSEIEVATPQEYKNIKEQALANHTENFNFNAEDGSIMFTTTNGSQIHIDGNCLTLNGNAITGQVDLEYTELFDKGSMLTTNKPTMGVLPNGDKSLLISGGEFFIEATQNGILLDTNCPLQVTIPTSLTGGDDFDMTLWEGTIDENENLTWEENNDAAGQNGVFLDGTLYNVFFASFGWNNVDRFYSDPRPKTTLLVSVPEGYDNLNSNVYLSYDGEDTGLANLDQYDPVTGLFTEHYGQIPIGLECQMIFATAHNDNWRYAIKSVTITEDQTYTFEYSETIVATEAELTLLINGLP